MKKIIRSFVGMDVHKATISISVAEDGRGGAVRFIGAIPNTPEAVGKMAKQLARHGELDFAMKQAAVVMASIASSRASGISASSSLRP